MEQTQSGQVNSKGRAAGHGGIGDEAKGATEALQRLKHRLCSRVGGKGRVQEGEVVGFPDGPFLVVGKLDRQCRDQLLQEYVDLPVEAHLPSFESELSAVGDAFTESAPDFILGKGATRRVKGVTDAVYAKLGPTLVDFVVLNNEGLPEVESHGFDVSNHGAIISVWGMSTNGGFLQLEGAGAHKASTACEDAVKEA